MTGRERIEAAFSDAGTTETAAVICYEGVYIRDRWDEITGLPWWYQFAPDIERQMEFRTRAVQSLGQDWFNLPLCLPGAERNKRTIEERPDGVFLAYEDGRRDRLERPPVGGTHIARPSQDDDRSRPNLPQEVDREVPLPDEIPEDAARDGRSDLADALLDRFGRTHFPIHHVHSPLWETNRLWGFEGMLTRTATEPDLVEYACGRLLELALHKVRQCAEIGVAGIWIEECFTDMLSPDSFRRLNVPFMKRLVDGIRSCGMKSIYYFSGNPGGRWEHILSVGADALALEESKKGFQVDVSEVAGMTNGGCVLLGNLDAVGVLQEASSAGLEKEVSRQIDAGKANGRRFIMSTGSPVTPATPVQRVREYCDLVHRIGGMQTSRL